MKTAGPCKVFSLSGPPPTLYQAKHQKRRTLAGVFEPYQEALPLESGYYTYVLDQRGRFRVERGNTSSHAGMVGGEPVGAAGNFWISRAGKVGRVDCRSHDYRFFIRDEGHPTVRFVIDAFDRSQAFDLSDHACFSFSRGIADGFRTTVDGRLVEDAAELQRLLEAEGQGPAVGLGFDSAQIAAYRDHRPVAPDRLYAVQADHHDEPLDFDSNDPAADPGKAPYRPADGPLGPGRKAFILDDEGRLVVGYGHHLLSGGRPVGAAGQIHVDEAGRVVEISLNFSGHYRPPLSAGYARYTYRSLVAHPLLVVAPGCRISARKTFQLATSLETLEFSGEELASDDPALNLALESLRDESAFEVDDDIPIDPSDD